jgi:hypothetical protein
MGGLSVEAVPRAPIIPAHLACASWGQRFTWNGAKSMQQPMFHVERESPLFHMAPSGAIIRFM